MKKILKNKKGFTLVELLAVIVVLAIIMVIATQRIGNVIKGNTASSFESTLAMVSKSAKQADMLESGTLEVEDIKKLVDYDPKQYEISLATTTNTDDTVCITAKSDGKFGNLLKADVAGAETATHNGKDVVKICKQFRNENVATPEEEKAAYVRNVVADYKKFIEGVQNKIINKETDITCNDAYVPNKCETIYNSKVEAAAVVHDNKLGECYDLVGYDLDDESCKNYYYTVYYLDPEKELTVDETRTLLNKEYEKATFVKLFDGGSGIELRMLFKKSDGSMLAPKN